MLAGLRRFENRSRNHSSMVDSAMPLPIVVWYPQHMTNDPPFETLSESESRYRSLRAAVADYHYHVEVEDGRIRRKIHGARCAAVTGYTAEYRI